MAQWFVQQKEDVVGPLTPADLLALVRRGAVTQDTKLRKDDSSWFPASDVGGLFEAAVRPTVVLRCPRCTAVVGEPPCMCPQCGSELHQVRRQMVENRIASPAEIAKLTGVSASMKNWLSKVKRKPPGAN